MQSLIPVVDLLNHNEGGMPIHVRPSDDGHNVTWVWEKHPLLHGLQTESFRILSFPTLFLFCLLSLVGGAI